MTAETFKCELCHGVFDKCWSDEESMAETKKLFGDVSMEECGVVCDYCFKKIDPRQFEVV